ncbi:MAG: hypothetical protein KGP14_08925 [Betaproteobacteria bacterium]|nr:hypothetical protein [Betaproteobacteria bacterium]
MIAYPRLLSVRLTLLVPELIWPEPNDQLTLGKLSAPGFEWLAARAALEHESRQAFETALAKQFGVEQAPFGALRLLGEASGETAHEGHWLCADPVHLRFHHERIVLADAGAFDIDDDEADALAGALNETFADVGRFHVATSRRWYLRLNEPIEHPAETLSTIAGRRMDGELSGKETRLTRWLNEVQMFLHGHPVNEKRQAAGKPAINSLWLWGGGSLPSLQPAAWSAVSTNNPLATGFALASGIPAQTLQTDLTTLLDHSQGDRQLIVLDALLPPVLYEDSEGWKNAWHALDRDWFAPLQGAAGRRIESLSVIAPTIYGQLTWTLRSKDRWKFWRKSRPLASLAKELAKGEAL